MNIKNILDKLSHFDFIILDKKGNLLFSSNQKENLLKKIITEVQVISSLSEKLIQNLNLGQLLTIEFNSSIGKILFIPTSDFYLAVLVGETKNKKQLEQKIKVLLNQ